MGTTAGQFITALTERHDVFDRFVDWRTCEAALINQDPAVTELAMGYLREFAADGDPFSQALLANTPVPPN